MLILAITHAVKIFLKRNSCISLWQGRKYIFAFLIFKHSTFDLHFRKTASCFFTLKKHLSFFFLICHCTKRATDNKMNPHVKKISKRKKKKKYACIIHFTLPKKKSKLGGVADCWKSWGPQWGGAQSLMLRMTAKCKPKKPGTHLWLSPCVYMCFWPDWNQARGDNKANERKFESQLGLFLPCWTKIVLLSAPTGAPRRLDQRWGAGSVQQELREGQDIGLASKLKVSVSLSSRRTRAL